MKTSSNLSNWPIVGVIAAVAVFTLVGCKSNGDKPTETAASPPPSVAAAPAVSEPAPAPSQTTEFPPPPVRIKAGPSEPFKDADGNLWLTERGFVGGFTVERPYLDIANTKTPAIYHSERYSMESFSYPVPNGKYIVKLHFCETFEGIGGPGERVFTFNVEGKEFKDFDVWVKAGGPLRAYVETVEVEVTDGKLDITFTHQVENPEINGIEILPAQ
ncbi:MAG: malectin [Verrucomicrobiae bacterium]|nr:malectin [Verrucomicrobiae bacterium]